MLHSSLTCCARAHGHLIDQVILGTVMGAVLGRFFSVLMTYSHGKKFIDRESYIAQYLSLALLTIGIAKTIGSDDLLAAFAAGRFYRF